MSILKRVLIPSFLFVLALTIAAWQNQAPSYPSVPNTSDWVKSQPAQLDTATPAPTGTPLPEPVPAGVFSWAIGPILDQGEFGACVGFAYEDLLNAEPFSYVGLWPHPSEWQIYFGAHDNDGIDDAPYYEGTTLEAAAWWLIQEGTVDYVDWTESTARMADFILHEGPVIVGSNWLFSMDYMSNAGVVNTNGDDARGNHAYLCYGYSSYTHLFSCQNSWGDWGYRHGLFKITYTGMRKLIEDESRWGFVMLPHKNAHRWDAAFNSR